MAIGAAMQSGHLAVFEGAWSDSRRRRESTAQHRPAVSVETIDSNRR